MGRYGRNGDRGLTSINSGGTCPAFRRAQLLPSATDLCPAASLPLSALLQGTTETRVQERKGADRIYWYQVGRERLGEGRSVSLPTYVV